MGSKTPDSSKAGHIRVLLDGSPVTVPPERRTPSAIRSYLDTLALQHQRILCSFSIDGKPVAPVQSCTDWEACECIEAETLDLEHLPLQLVRTARQQTAENRTQVQSAIVLVLINEGRVAREFWWELARKLKEPLLTLTLLPENICGPIHGFASFLQLRKWQLEQLSMVLGDIDEACWREDTRALSNALEHRALPWLDHLDDLLLLCHETFLAGIRAAADRI